MVLEHDRFTDTTGAPDHDEPAAMVETDRESIIRLETDSKNTKIRQEEIRKDIADLRKEIAEMRKAMEELKLQIAKQSGRDSMASKIGTIVMTLTASAVGGVIAHFWK